MNPGVRSHVVLLVLALAPGGLVAARGPANTAATQADRNDPAAAALDHGPAPAVAQANPHVPGLPDATERERAGLGLLSVIDQYQLDLSRLALGRDLDDATLAFAETLLRAQSAHRASHDPWLPDLAQPRAQEHIRRGQRRLARLQDVDAATFPAAYLQAVRRSQVEALALLDEELIPHATSADVRVHLLQARDRVARQLQSHPGDPVPSPGAMP